MLNYKKTFSNIFKKRSRLIKALLILSSISLLISIIINGDIHSETFQAKENENSRSVIDDFPYKVSFSQSGKDQYIVFNMESDVKVMEDSQKVIRRLLPNGNSSSTSPVRVVIIFTSKRSGSSLLGELFNQNREIFYLFEPLFPYTRNCDVLRRERTSLLEKISLCEFGDIPQDYVNAFRATKHTDKNSKCLRHNMCFSDRNMNVLYRYVTVCKNPSSPIDYKKASPFKPYSKCGYPLNMTVLSSLCNAADLVVYKIIRVCNIADLETMFSNLALQRKGVAVLHLVRDPRAVLSSRLLLSNDELTEASLESEAKMFCERNMDNIKYASKMWKDKLMVVKGTRYMRLRYEDLTTEPLGNAYSVYKFLGKTLPNSVKLWIRISLLSEKERHKVSSDPYSTFKIGQETLNTWRKRLGLYKVLAIQRHCRELMELLNYKTVSSSKELINFNMTLW